MFFFSSRRRHTRYIGDWSSDVCSSDLPRESSGGGTQTPYHRAMIAVPSRPSPLDLDLHRTALLVIDMQNDFGSPGGMFDRAGIDITGIRASVDRKSVV